MSIYRHLEVDIQTSRGQHIDFTHYNNIKSNNTQKKNTQKKKIKNFLWITPENPREKNQ